LAAQPLIVAAIDLTLDPRMDPRFRN